MIPEILEMHEILSNNGSTEVLEDETIDSAHVSFNSDNEKSPRSQEYEWLARKIENSMKEVDTELEKISQEDSAEDKEDRRAELYFLKASQFVSLWRLNQKYSEQKNQRSGKELLLEACIHFQNVSRNIILF